MCVEVNIRSETRIPAGVIGQVDVSIPRGDRLLALNRWAGLPPTELTQAIGAANWEMANASPVSFAAGIAELHARLRTIDTDAVWLVPNSVQAKRTYEQHLSPFCRSPAKALIAAGLRDTFQNTYKWIFADDGAEPTLYCRAVEPLTRRSYTVLYQTQDEPWRLRGGIATVVDGRPVIDGESRPVRFAIAATPLVEAGKPVDDARRIGNQADLRHEFRMGQNVGLLRELQSLLLPGPDAAASGRRVLGEARRVGLADEDGYFLTALGVTAAGDAILLSDHCSARELAQQLSDSGADFALLTEEGGSGATVVQQLARDYSPGGGFRLDANGQHVWAAPVRYGNNTYHRDLALAAVVFSLTELVLEKPFRS